MQCGLLDVEWSVVPSNTICLNCLITVVVNLVLGGKKGGHTATPHPAKQAGKAPVSVKQQTPKSDAKISCKSCNKYDGSLLSVLKIYLLSS